MMRQQYEHQQIVIPPPAASRSSSSIISSSSYKSNDDGSSSSSIRRRRRRPSTNTTTTTATAIHRATTAFLRSLLSSIFKVFVVSTSSSPTCTSWLTITSFAAPRKLVTGTLFGYRRGHVTFAVQTDPRSQPVFLIDLAVSTTTLVKEMSSGFVRIALESGTKRSSRVVGTSSSYGGATWTMYCNGRKCGYANSRGCCSDSDWRVLSTVRTVSVGAGVIPTLEDGRGGACELGELLYMRAKFERVAGSGDAEAYYMLNPDGNNGGPELSIFLLSV